MLVQVARQLLERSQAGSLGYRRCPSKGRPSLSVANPTRRSELGGDCLILPLVSVRRLLPEVMTGHVNEDVLEAGT